MDKFRIGNLIDTRDGNGLSRIVNIKNDEIVEYEKQSKPGDFFVSHIDRIRPILLSNNHLTILGFKEHNKEYSLNGLKIINIGEIEGDKDRLGFIDHGHMVLPEDFNEPLNSESIKQLTQVTFLHSLQNYCADNQINLDFNSIKD